MAGTTFETNTSSGPHAKTTASIPTTLNPKSPPLTVEITRSEDDLLVVLVAKGLAESVLLGGEPSAFEHE